MDSKCEQNPKWSLRRPVTQNSQTDAKHFNGLSLKGKQTHTELHYNPTAITQTTGDKWNKSFFCGVNERKTAKILETDLKRKPGSLLLPQKHSWKQKAETHNTRDVKAGIFPITQRMKVKSNKKNK